ncbi:MAG: hypothetical protein KF845_04470 [Cyclobacteriaceae bacterium]|nr:hypothetical protein [Cyclobacteriaceae bacterium]
MITTYCHIRNKTILLKGETIFSNKQSLLGDFLINAYDFLKPNYPKFYKMDNLSKLGFLAAEVLLRDKTIKDYPTDAVAVVLSNATASLDTDYRFQQSAENVASPALFVYTLANIVAGEICIRHNITGENAFFVTPAFDAELLHLYTNSLLAQDDIHACLTGWVNVLDEQHDVFLYLTEKQHHNTGIEHTASALTKLYTQ